MYKLNDAYKLEGGDFLIPKEGVSPPTFDVIDKEKFEKHPYFHDVLSEGRMINSTLENLDKLIKSSNRYDKIHNPFDKKNYTSANLPSDKYNQSNIRKK